jgi:heterodisulfide reductase subunit A-like polyferredoxin
MAKFAHEIEKRAPGTVVAEFTWDRVLGGDKVRGMTLGKNRPANLPEVPLGPGDRLKVEPLPSGGGRVLFSQGDQWRAFSAELVVLAAPHAGAAAGIEMADMMGLQLDDAGFAMPANRMLQSFASRTDGIFLAGAAQGQKNVAESSAQGAAAAGAILSALVPGKTLVREAATACVDEALCGGCSTCVLACPFGAVTFNRTTKHAEINELLCRGCGTCAAACPSAAITAKHFTDAQLLAEIRALAHAGSVSG